MKRIIPFFAGLLTGALLFGGSLAYAAELTVERSRQTIYVDGAAVELEAYLINGSNYIKLRDVGQAVDFNVYWDGSAVRIQSAEPYTGEAPAAVSETVPELTALDDWSMAVNSSIFDSVLTREAYSALRQTVMDRELILSGVDYEYASLPLSDASFDAMQGVAAAIGSWPSYSVKRSLDGQVQFTVKYPENYRAAADYCAPFVQRLGNLDDAAKVKELAFFVCDRLTYRASGSASPRTALVSDNVSEGNCMSYARNFKFLCDLTGIPCILIHSDVHQWDRVYVDGAWRNVDVCALDAGDDATRRAYQQILYTDAEMQGSIYRQSQPALTIFAEEVLVPGSSV